MERQGVSIHAPGWARLAALEQGRGVYKFQFTRPGGRDKFTRSKFILDNRFNSRARVGATG